MRVGEKGIASVNDDIALFEQWRELIDDSVNRRARFHHDHRFARARERSHEFLYRLRGLNVFPFGPPACEFLRDFCGAVENSDRESFRFHVQGEIFAHHGQTDQANITLIRAHFRISLCEPQYRGDSL